MKIQEMRSGILHLNKKVENERREDFFIVGRAGELDESEEALDPASEHDEPCWSVISFDQREAGGMTYAAAAKLIAELDSHGVTGLCIITDDASKRMRA